MKNKIAITLGCPAGIGPEVLLKALNELSDKLSQIVVIGDKKVLSQTSSRLGIPFPKVEIISLSELDITPGVPTLEGYKAMVLYIEKAIELAKNNQVKAIVTCPISKKGLSEVGVPYKGHTEWLANAFGVKDYVMCFYSEDLIVSLVTTHIPLSEVPKKLSVERVLKVCKLSAEFLRLLKKEDFKIGLCGVNPHAGEGGLLGNEEKEILEKVVEICKKEGIPLEGPLPADSVFYLALKGKYDLVVAMYHDQGLAPFKLLHFEDGVNITLGLPIIRTSPVHGTAYNIAGKGIANHKSLVSAIRLALRCI